MTSTFGGTVRPSVTAWPPSKRSDSQVGGRPSRVAGQRHHLTRLAALLQPPLQLERELEVGQLGARVGAPLCTSEGGVVAMLLSRWGILV